MYFRGKSLLESWVAAFVHDWQPPLIFVQFTWVLAILSEDMDKKFKLCKSCTKAATHDSKSDLPLV